MLDHQKPLRSTFGPETTASEVLSSINIAGKRAIITGGHSGIGLETTRALARAGAAVTVASRNIAEATSNTSDIPGVTVEMLDLSDLASIEAFAARLVARSEHIDLLINNAGVMACPETRVPSGWELQLATNHLGHFALTNRLWPVLEGGARVVSLSSAGHHLSPMRWDDLHLTSHYDKWLAYGQSKTANALFAVWLDELGRSRNVRAFAVHPGNIATPLQRHLTHQEMLAQGWINEKGEPLIALKTPEQGAATTLWAATSECLDGLGGLYCEDCDVAILASENGPLFVGVKAHAIDAAEAARLWQVSAHLTGVNAFSQPE